MTKLNEQESRDLGFVGTEAVEKKDQISKKKPEVKASQNLGGFVAETQAELKKIEWPARKQVIKSSVIIFVLLVCFTLLVAAMDIVYSKVFIILKGF